jgi:hypothetical protein
VLRLPVWLDGECILIDLPSCHSVGLLASTNALASIPRASNDVVTMLFLSDDPGIEESGAQALFRR